MENEEEEITSPYANSHQLSSSLSARSQPFSSQHLSYNLVNGLNPLTCNHIPTSTRSCTYLCSNNCSNNPSEDSQIVYSHSTTSMTVLNSQQPLCPHHSYPGSFSTGSISGQMMCYHHSSQNSINRNFSSTCSVPNSLLNNIPDCLARNIYTQNNFIPGALVTVFGTVSVFLHHNIRVDMTVDNTIRVVNVACGCSAATNVRGNASCLLHQEARIYHEGTKVEAQIYGNRWAKFDVAGIYFSADPSAHVYYFTSNGVRLAQTNFADLRHDVSLDIFYGNARHGPYLIPKCFRLIQSSCSRVENCGNFVWVINGTRITQMPKGDVEVSGSRRFIRTTPTGNLEVRTPFVHLAVEVIGKVRIRRGLRTVYVSPLGMHVSNGKQKTGLDENKRLISS